jgi:hypothetical protein
MGEKLYNNVYVYQIGQNETNTFKADPGLEVKEPGPKLCSYPAYAHVCSSFWTGLAFVLQNVYDTNYKVNRNASTSLKTTPCFYMLTNNNKLNIYSVWNSSDYTSHFEKEITPTWFLYTSCVENRHCWYSNDNSLCRYLMITYHWKCRDNSESTSL